MAVTNKNNYTQLFLVQHECNNYALDKHKRLSNKINKIYKFKMKDNNKR